jgi:hypothetical protein
MYFIFELAEKPTRIDSEMHNLTLLNSSKLKTLTSALSSLSGLAVKATAATLAVGVIDLISKPALADPPPNPGLPSIFCFRITDIREDKTDPENNKFTFEFETLNWTDRPATDIDIALNVGTDNGLFFSNSGVDQNGAPLGSDPNWNPNPRVPGGPILPPGSPAPFGTPNKWSVTESTSTYIRWANGLEPAIPNIDLLDISNKVGEAGEEFTVAYINNSLPDASSTGSFPNKDFDPPYGGHRGNQETVDNGTNVLDGFTFTVDNFDPGEILSFNWFLTNNGVPIGTAAGGNNFGWGILNLARVDNGLNPPPLFGFTNGAGFNTGFQQTAVQFYDSVNVVPATFTAEFGERTAVQFYDSVNVVPAPAIFTGEFGGGGTAQFLNPQDSQTICGPGGCPVNLTPIPEPSSTAAIGLTGLAMLGYGWRRRKGSK